MSPQRNHLLWLLIGVGIALRCTDLTFPDFDTDEAQAALAATAAWTPVGMLTFKFSQVVFGHEVILVRSVSVLFGIAFLPLLYLLARHVVRERRATEDIHKTALLITALAALFPSHILFSRLAYLSTQLLLGWTLTLYCFLKARETQEERWYLALFFASIYATMIKTQGLVLPALLMLGAVAEQWKAKRQFSIFNFQFSIFYVLLLSLIPVSLYILTHPGIFATLLLYGGNLYGVSHFFTRITNLLSTFWHALSLFLLAVIFSLRFLSAFNWPVVLTLLWVSVHGLLLGPQNPYYTTELVLFALPLGVGLARLSPLLRNATLSILLATTLALLGPRSLMLNRWTLEPFKKEGYWKTHAEILNEQLRGEKAVTVLGYPGHQLRWYIEPRVRVGRQATPPYPTEYVIVLEDAALAKSVGDTVYADDRLTIVKQKQ